MANQAEELRRRLCEIFQPIIKRLDAQTCTLNHDELFIISRNVVLWLPVDRDGFDLCYVRPDAHGGFQVYRLGMALWSRSPGVFTSDSPNAATWSGRVEAEAQLAVRILEAVGQDVLSGDKMWLMKYEEDGSRPWPLPAALAQELCKILASG